MNNQEAIEVMFNEWKCIDRNDGIHCDRKCESCDLVMDVQTIREAFNMAISALQAQETKTQLSAEGTTSDLISRQDAIDALWEIRQEEISDGRRFHDYCSLSTAVDVIKDLPSAHPEIQKRKEESAQNVPKEDLISRKAATDALDNIKIPRNASWYPYYQQALTAVSKLPSAQPEPCNLPQFDATCDGDILVKGVKMPKGCVYEGEDGKTEYCFLCNHADVPFCMYLEWEPEAAIGIDERPCYCPLEPQEPCEDAVSRKYILNCLAEYIEEYGELDSNGLHDLKWCAMKEAEMVVKDAPSVISKQIECEDAVSREAAIDVAENAFVRGLLASPDIRRLPSVQPEIVRCKDCKYCVPGYITDNDDFIPPRCGRLRQTMRISGDDYCSFGERRTDGVDS